MNNISLSLADILGQGYVKAVCKARAALCGDDYNELYEVATQRVEFYPESFAQRQDSLMQSIGKQVCEPFENSLKGAPTSSYAQAQNSFAAPIGGEGCFRIGENGKLYFAGKSEHYHIPLGHSFRGYQLIENAKKLGIPNATHNNTRGYITRLAERSLIAAANGMSVDDAELENVLNSRENGVINTVINLETGSLAVEAALKMMLHRFYTIDGKKSEFSGKTPVFIVMADNAGGITAGYHGTTVIAQTLRGLWPEYLEKAEKAGLYKIVAAPINDINAFEALAAKYNTGEYKTAGFCHEIIMMNYGGIRLSEEFLQKAYEICRSTSTPILCDEIQSCAWYEGLFLFKQYGLKPDFVSIGKGFPGGTYPASKILTSAVYDSLSQFGALVTNGQEELASLAYLITIAFINANGEHITTVGKAYHSKMAQLVRQHKAMCTGVEGDAHMSAICFKEVHHAVEFCKIMNETYGVDISAQAYKPNCPPVALTKLPLIVSEAMCNDLIELFDMALSETEHLNTGGNNE